MTHRVLIIDDEADIAEILGEIVEGEGCSVELACNGRQALQRIADAEFDLVLSDLVMPEMDGAALFRRLRDTRPALCERMVFITGDTLSESAQRFLAEVRRPVIEKPFIPDDVREIVRGLLPSGNGKRQS